MKLTRTHLLFIIHEFRCSVYYVCLWMNISENCDIRAEILVFHLGFGQIVRRCELKSTATIVLLLS